MKTPALLRVTHGLRGSPAATLSVVMIAVFTDMVVYSLVVPILPRYARSLGASQTAIGFLFASYAIALLLTLPVCGALSDRIGRRTPMLWGLLGLGGSTLLYAFAESYPQLVVARLLQGVAGAVTWTTGLAVLADVYPSEQRGKALGMVLSATAAGGVAGPALGGFLFDWGGYRLPFMVVAALAFADGLARLLLLDEPPRRTEEHRPSLVRLTRDHSVLLVSGVVVLGATVFSLLEPVIPLHLQDRLGASPAAIGLIFTGMMLGFGFSSPLAGAVSSRLGPRRCMAFGLALMAVAVPLLSVPRHLAVEAAAMVVVGAGVGMALAPTLPELADTVDRLGGGSYGSAYAIWNAMWAVGMVAGPLAGAMLRTSLGLHLTLIIASAPLLLYAALVVRPQPPTGGGCDRS